MCNGCWCVASCAACCGTNSCASASSASCWLMPFGTAMAAEALEEAACNPSSPLPAAGDPCGDQGRRRR